MVGPLELTSNKKLFFLDYPGYDALNPIPDWGHLIYDKEFLYEILNQKHIPEQDISQILSWIFDCDQINRLAPKKMLKEIAKSGFISREIEYIRRQIPVEVISLLKYKNIDSFEASIDGMRLVLSK